MKILCLHVDYINFKPLKKALKNAKELEEKEKQQQKVGESLVVLTSVEKGDNAKSAVKLAENIEDVAGQVKAKTVVLYPYAHLSSNLASPETAEEILKEAEKELKKKFKVVRAPFGYYKEFELKVKGHPLSELSREIVGEESRESEDGEKFDIEQLRDRLTKVRMSAPKGKNGLKSNVEIGRDMDLYIVSEVVGQGLPLLTPRGATIKREIERFIVDEEIKREYLHVSTPVMAKSDLYKISGHWQHYKEGMFVMDLGNEKFALRPMTCPFHFVLYKSKPRSYKEMPVRYAEISTLFRNEKSGELRGLSRVRQFTLADAHLICKPEQIEEEFAKVLDLIRFSMEKLGISDVWYRFSKWDPKNKEKYVDNPKAWEETQKMMKKILDKLKLKYVEAENEAAFYGPKLDLQYKDVYGKEDTLFTVQIDFALPEKFNLTYVNEKGKEERAMVIHRSSTGATERVIAHLLELNQGSLKTWLSPTQVRVLSFTDRNDKHARKVIEQIGTEIPNIRMDADFRSVPVSTKVKDSEIMKIPYIIVIGDREEKEGTVAVREKGNSRIKSMKISDFIKELKEEIAERK